jgi:hypothetical protein
MGVVSVGDRNPVAIRLRRIVDAQPDTVLDEIDEAPRGQPLVRYGCLQDEALAVGCAERDHDRGP